MRDTKVVFFDIDGTIWDEKNNIPDSTVQAIRDLHNNGHLAFLNSGRSRAFIRHPNLLNLGFDGIVSGCGTMVEYHGKTVFYHRIPVEQVEETLQIIRRFGFRPILEGRKYLYMNEEDFDYEPYGKKVRRDMGEDIRTIEGCRGEWEISKLSCATTDCDVAGCYEQLKDRYDFMIHNPEVVEIVPKGFHKGTGILEVCRMLHLPVEQTVAIGDSINDTEMLQTAGFSVAMGNGTEEIKQLADYVTAPMKEDGIYQALTHLDLI